MVPVSKAACFDDLPEDIIIDILIRLPTRSLVSSKSVCKLWLYLISNPKFVKTHLEKSHLLNSYDNHMLIFTHGGRVHNQGGRSSISYFIKSLPVNNDNESNVVVLDYPTRDPRNKILFLGSCDGLVCIAIDKVGLFLWNPCTRISRELPHSGLMIDMLTSYGLGYNRFSDDYKVVLTGYIVGSKLFENKTVMKVYSLKSNSWGEIQVLHRHNDTIKLKAEHFNGVLHWEGLKYENFYLVQVIVTLDLGNEIYGEIEQPCYGRDYISFIKLGVLEGCFSVFCHFNDPNGKFCVDIWIMKEYGISDTWIKLYTIPYTTEHTGFVPASYMPSYVSITGEILTKIRGGFVVYNPSSGRFNRPIYDSFVRSFFLYRQDILNYQATTYVESLVSPNIYEEMSNNEH